MRPKIDVFWKQDFIQNGNFTNGPYSLMLVDLLHDWLSCCSLKTLTGTKTTNVVS